METSVEIVGLPRPAAPARGCRSAKRNECEVSSIVCKAVCVAALIFSLCTILLASGQSHTVSRKEKSRDAIPLGSTAIRINMAVKQAGGNSSLERDVCLKKSSNLEQAACIQPLLEAFYGRQVTELCPNLGLLLAHHECSNCPWDQVNPSSNVSLTGTSFHTPGRECSVANHVKPYSKWSNVDAMYQGPLYLVALIVVVLSILGIASGTRVKVLGIPVPEAVFLAIYWTVFSLYVGFWARSQDFLIYCKSWIDAAADAGPIAVLYGTVLFVSGIRCLKLRSHADETSRNLSSSSWWSFLSAVFTDWKITSRKTRVLAVLVAMLPSFVLLCFGVFHLFVIPVGSEEWTNRCFAGYKDYAMGAIQVSKVVLEALSVVIYAFGPQKNPFRQKLRFLVLSIILATSLVLLGLTFTNLYKQLGLSAMFPRAMDTAIAGPFTEAVHAIVITLFGLLEPWRIETAVGENGDKEGNDGDEEPVDRDV